MIVHVGLTGAEEDKKKPNRDGNLKDRLQKDRLVQPDKGHGRLLQEFNTALQEKTVKEVYLFDVHRKKSTNF